MASHTGLSIDGTSKSYTVRKKSCHNKISGGSCFPILERMKLGNEERDVQHVYHLCIVTN